MNLDSLMNFMPGDSLVCPQDPGKSAQNEVELLQTKFEHARNESRVARFRDLEFLAKMVDHLCTFGPHPLHDTLKSSTSQDQSHDD